jgi:glycerophosphoryl diester phosphodiesterase
LVIGHRGATQTAAENTVRACQAAIECGADGVEVDVCVTRDDVLVLWHDRDPDDAISVLRQTGLEGSAFVARAPDRGCENRRAVGELTLAEMRAAYGYVRRADLPRDWVDADAREAADVETWDTFVEWAANERRARALFIDVKLSESELHKVPVLIEHVTLACERHPSMAEKSVYLLCPHEEVFQAIATSVASRPELGCFLPTADFEHYSVVDTAKRLAARHVSIGATPRHSWARVRVELASAVAARARGDIASVTVWTINDEEQIADACQLGVDAIITDDSAACVRVAVRARQNARVTG